MFCSKCGNQLGAGAAFCPNCGTPAGTPVSNVYVAPPVQPDAQQSAVGQGYGGYNGYNSAPVSGLAVAALVVAFFAPLIGLILGYSARKDINNSQGAKGGRGVATAAIALGWIFTIIGVIAAAIYVAYLVSLSSNYYY